MAFHIVRNDIARMNVDVIVNSANPQPTYAYGTDSAIYKAAGAEQMLSERKQIGIIEPGSAAFTSAGLLHARYVIHTVAPLWQGGNSSEFEILASCYKNSLQLARELHCKSIAFPLLATGVYGFPKDKALETAMSVIQSFLLRYNMDVFLVVFDEKSFVLSGKIFDRIQSYVDSNYIESAAEEEYKLPSSNGKNRITRDDERLRLDTLKSLANSRNIPKAVSDFHEIKSETPFNADFQLDTGTKDELTFQEKLFQYIDQSGLKPSAIYKPIELSRQQYSRIQSNKQYQPKKSTALLFAIVLKLSLPETEDLLSRAGYAFNPSSKQDLIVKACLLNGQYDLFVIDAMMQKNNLDTLIDYDGKG